MKRFQPVSVALACALILSALVSLANEGSSARAANSVPAFDHIFTIVMENHAYSQIIGSSSAPYINSLAGQYGLATSYHAVSHPSLPNYLALTGASTFGVTSDCTSCYQSAPNIAVDRVAASGRTWRAYMESMPSSCYVGSSGDYVQKHDPFVYYDDIRTDPAQCGNVVPYTDLAGDLASASTTPNYVWISPNLCNDMHDCSISTGDTWLKNHVPTILNSPAFTSQNSVLFITFDEDDGSQGNQVATLVIAKGVPAGYRSSTSYNHYSYLATIEQAWGLSPLTSNDGNASAMSDFFGAPANTPVPTPTATATTAPSATATPIPTATATSAPQPTATGTPTSTSVNTPAATATSAPASTPTNTPAPKTPTPAATATATKTAPTVHVGDLDGVGTSTNGEHWDYAVTVLVHDGAHAPVEGATVSGDWTTDWQHDAAGSASCTTDSSGHCRVTLSDLGHLTTNASYTVTGISSPGATYRASANHDPDGNSNGTTITVTHP